MPVKTRKLRLDIETLHRARRKLQILQSAVKSTIDNEDDNALMAAICNDLSLPTPHECKVLLDLIQDAETVLYPSFQEMSIHEYQLTMLGKIDSIHQADQFNEIADKVHEYEQKYCR